MYDHIGLKVKDIGASLRFYTAALAPLGYPLCSSDASGGGCGHACRVPRRQSCGGRSVPQGRPESRRARQRQIRPARRLQPDLLRGISD